MSERSEHHLFKLFDENAPGWFCPRLLVENVPQVKMLDS